MKITGTLTLFRLCLIITGLSPINLSMSLYYIKRQMKRDLESYHSNLKNFTIEKIVSSPPQKTQSKESQMKKMIKSERGPSIAIFKNKAYWVKDNTIFFSDLDSNGKIVTNNIKELDVFSLSDKEMDSLIKIIDTLND
jgi:hypothetical protein